jgi:hypothetical protein
VEIDAVLGPLERPGAPATKKCSKAAEDLHRVVLPQNGGDGGGL